MRMPQIVLGFAVLAVVALTAFVTRDYWLAWLAWQDSETAEEQPAGPGPDEPRLLKLTSKARENLKLTSKPALVQAYPRTIEVPGIIIDRPGQSDRAVVAPAAGVVASIHAFPGDTLKPGDRLFTLRLIGEQVQTTQAELFKTAREVQIVQEQRKRLEELAKTVELPEIRFIDLDNQLKRFSAAIQAHRQDLLSRGFTAAQVDGIAEGKLVSEIEVKAPAAPSPPHQITDKGQNPPFTYEVEQLKVELGQQVNAGQLLCLVGDHRLLYIEGHSFKREAAWLEQAAQKEWPVRVVFAEDEGAGWPPLPASFTIRHLSNTVDPASRTFSFYLPLTNQSRSYQKDGRTFLVWRFRPGQRVRLHVPVEEYHDVLVVPAAAVVREGPEAYVFRQNGDLFERRAVRVLHEDRLATVIANDGAIRPGIDYVAQGSAASLNRILKAQNAGGGLPPGAHFHADGSLHVPGK
jgi:cobalt-zinc-cadmium efflux system membrane fusion protein